MAYADIAFADTYLASVAAWNAATVTDPIKQRALDLGTVAIDGAVTWVDGVTPATEDAVKQANCELALIEVTGDGNNGGIFPLSSTPIVAETERVLGPLETKTRYRAQGSSGRGDILTRFPVVKSLLNGLIETSSSVVLERA